MTDKKAVFISAQLYVAGLLPPVWVPPLEVRHLWVMVAQRWKMVQLGTKAKCCLQLLLHRQHLEPSLESDFYMFQMRGWWEELPLELLE